MMLFLCAIPIYILLLWTTLQLHTVPAQIERRRSNFRLGFFGEDFTK